MSSPRRKRSGFAERDAPVFRPQGRRRTAPKDKPLEIPLTAAQRDLIERAAEISGRSVAEFAVDSVETAARRLMSGYQPVVLDPKYAASFAKAFLKAPRPNKALRDAAKRYLARTKS